MAEEQSRDKALFEQIQQDDKTAFRLLFDHYYPLLIATAVNLLKDINLAKDVVQEVFFQIWKNRKQIVITGLVAAYLKRAVINRSLNQIKARRNLAQDDTLHQKESDDPDPIELLNAQYLNTVLKKALESLPERCRLVFVMCRMEGMSHKQIAEQLDISTKTVENQMTKALKVLKTAILPHVKKSKKA